MKKGGKGATTRAPVGANNSLCHCQCTLLEVVFQIHLMEVHHLQH